MDQLNWHKLQDAESTKTDSSADHLVPADQHQKTQQYPEAVLGTAFSEQVMEGRC